MVSLYVNGGTFLGNRSNFQDGMIRSSRSQTGHPARRMNPRLLGLILSLSGMLLGIALLLVCMYFYAVPHVLTADFLPVTCTITIQNKNKLKLATVIPYCGSDKNPCIAHRSKRDKEALTFDLPSEKETGCIMVQADFITLSGTQVLKAKVFLDPWTYYQVQLDTSRCPCPHCNFGGASKTDQTVPKGDVPYSSQHLLDCFYNPFNDQEVILEKLTPMLVLNAMLWPTILFISGFVGVFLSCIMRYP